MDVVLVKIIAEVYKVNTINNALSAKYKANLLIGKKDKLNK
jgi:hypothetical protein